MESKTQRSNQKQLLFVCAKETPCLCFACHYYSALLKDKVTRAWSKEQNTRATDKQTDVR